jgi:hypothetical protein
VSLCVFHSSARAFIWHSAQADTACVAIKKSKKKLEVREFKKSEPHVLNRKKSAIIQRYELRVLLQLD